MTRTGRVTPPGREARRNRPHGCRARGIRPRHAL